MDTIESLMTKAFNSQFTLSPLSEAQRAEVKILFTAFEKMRVAASEFKSVLEGWTEQDKSSPEFNGLLRVADFIIDYDPNVQPVIDRQFDATIESLEFTNRTTECLRNSGIVFVGQLVKRNENQLLAIDNLGRRALNEIKEVLATRELCLSMNTAGWKPPTE